jgi:hypothetical protein
VGRDAIVAGTGFKNSDGTDRSEVIRRHCKNGMNVRLVREPSNEHDPNAIAVLMKVPRVFGLLGAREFQIGYIKSAAAQSVAARMDSGQRVTAVVTSFFAPAGRDHPRVSLRLDYDGDG